VCSNSSTRSESLATRSSMTSATFQPGRAPRRRSPRGCRSRAGGRPRARPGRGDDAPLAPSRRATSRSAREPRRRGEGGDQDRRVEDQRDGRGSKTSSAASMLRSPRPELNAPMQVSGGCSPSTFALERLSLSAPANSCSSASHQFGAACRASPHRTKRQTSIASQREP